MVKSKDILFYIENEVQFDSLKLLLLYLRDKTKLSFDIVVPKDEGVNSKVFDGGFRVLSKNGFKVTRSVDNQILPAKILNIEYKIFMSAYIYRWHYDNVKAKYKIMFPYASYYLNKPNWTIDQFIKQDYLADALFSHAIGTKHVTDIFTKTYIVPSLKLDGFKKKQNKHKKPVLFFAPTYNEIAFMINILKDIDKIKEKYTVIMRGHHRVVNLDENKDISDQLYDKADMVYDVSDYPITTPLGEADVVLSDNSAVIFDAIYCGIPVALFSDDPNSFHYCNINTIQSDLVKNGDLLWTNNSKDILDVIGETLSEEVLYKQKNLQTKLFPGDKKNVVSAWMGVLLKYINDEIPYEYSLAKKYWIDNIRSLEKSNQEMREMIRCLDAKVFNCDDIISKEQNPGIKTAFKRLIRAFIRKIYISPKIYFKYLVRLYFRKFKIIILNNPIVIYQFIFTEPDSINFGDELTKDIIERLFNRKVEVHNQIDTKFDLIGVSSLIHFFNDVVDYKTYVWGSGLIDDNVSSINKNFIFKACRGKYTKSKIPKKYRGIPMGDPGLLCNLIYTNNIKKTDKIGVIPHFRDEHSFYLNNIIKNHPEIFKVISVGQSPEKVADEIRSCKLVLSSSLHGLILSDSFSVPNIHLKLSDNLLSSNHLRGGEYKFRDYYSGINREYNNFDPRNEDLLDLKKYSDIIKNYKPLNNLKEIQDNLIKEFPYK